MPSSPSSVLAFETALSLDGVRMLQRGAQRLAGAALVLAALGLWLAPGASWDSEVMLFKLVLSLMAGLAGAGLIGASVRPPAPEVEIDLDRLQVRLIRRLPGARQIVLQACPFDALSRVERSGQVLRLWDGAGRFLAEVSPGDAALRNRFVTGLRAAGKLV